MKHVGITRLRRHLAEYLRQVENGHEFVVTRRGDPVARLVPARTSERKRRPLSSHEELRRLIGATGTPLSQIITDTRRERF